MSTDEEPRRPALVNVSGNAWLIELVEDQLTGSASLSAAVISRAVSTVLTDTLPDVIPWWSDFLVAKDVAGSPAAREYQRILETTTSYMLEYWQRAELVESV